MRYPLEHMKIRTNQLGSFRPISNTFGMVRGVNNTQAHQGWDLEAAPGTAVYAIHFGGAERLPDHAQWGKRVRLTFLHNGTEYYAFYNHLSECTIGEGAPLSVDEGYVLGFTGTTGNASGLPQSEAHLHFGIATVPGPGAGLTNYIDPGEILGYRVYSSR